MSTNPGEWKTESHVDYRAEALRWAMELALKKPGEFSGHEIMKLAEEFEIYLRDGDIPPEDDENKWVPLRNGLIPVSGGAMSSITGTAVIKQNAKTGEVLIEVKLPHIESLEMERLLGGRTLRGITLDIEP